MIHHTFNLNAYSDTECLHHFRFTARQIVTVAAALCLPHVIYFRASLRQKFSLDRITSLCILLKRLAFPNRLLDLDEFFGIDSSTIDHIIITMVESLLFE